jgi:hypothetical protein
MDISKYDMITAAIDGAVRGYERDRDAKGGRTERCGNREKAM